MLKKIIPNSIKRAVINLTYKTIPLPGKVTVSYAQAGEDCILWYLFRTLGIDQPTYLDIGTNDPIANNNTYFFYKRGNRGVCVEADPDLFGDIVKHRKDDVCLNIGVTFDERKEADFYIFSLPSLNTLSKEEADYREKNSSYKVVKKIKIPLKNINNIIAENFPATLDLLSLDVEGIDFEVLKSMNFDKYRPKVICTETITYSENRTERKMVEIIDYLISKDYFVYADTHINTIFVDQKTFRNY